MMSSCGKIWADGRQSQWTILLRGFEGDSACEEHLGRGEGCGRGRGEGGLFVRRRGSVFRVAESTSLTHRRARAQVIMPVTQRDSGAIPSLMVGLKSKRRAAAVAYSWLEPFRGKKSPKVVIRPLTKLHIYSVAASTSLAYQRLWT